MRIKAAMHNREILSNAGVFMAFLAFSFLSFSLVSPIVSSNADTNTASTEAGPYISSISVDSRTSINITPTSTQSVYTGTNTISYTNTCPYGFNVTLTSASDNTSLTRYGTDSATKIIPSTTTTSLADNTWGVSTNNGSTYSPIPAISATPVNIINTFEATNNPATLNLIYGVKTDSSLPSGSYTNDLIYTVSAKPQCLTYAITWNLDGGTAPSGAEYPTTLNFGQTINLSSLTPAKEGYEFTGWSNGTATFDGTGTAANINPSNTLSVTMTAQWEPTQYSITYNLDGGSVATANPTSYTIETNTFTLNNPTKNGNAFLGWSNDTADWSDTEIHHENHDVDTPQIHYMDTENFYYGPYYKAPTGYYRLDVYGTSLNNANNVRVYEWQPTVSGNVNMIDKKLVDNNHLIIFIEVTSDANVHGIEAIIGGDITITKEEIRSIKDSISIQKGSTGNKAYTANWNTNMQLFSCNTLSSGSSITLTDTRDNNTYVVKKLADGKCWMTENLRLINKTISSADSNLPSGETYTVPASDLSSFTTTSYNTNSAYLDSTYGGYYNFYTATAGTGGTSLTSGNSPKDICPKGWRLPTGGSSGEFQTLYNNYNSSALMKGEPNFTFSGYVRNGSVHEQGSYGLFWSSTVDDASNAYSLYLNSSNVYPTNYDDRYGGISVRCVAEEPTMQTFESSMLQNVGDSMQLEDERNGNKYTVKKLADGKVWMTDNLRLVDVTISSANSNLPEGESYTIPASDNANFSRKYNMDAVYFDETYGGYYNFYTATAGWGTDSVMSGNSPKDICPKGWRLPTGGPDGEFQTLYNYYNSSEAMRGEPGFVFSGMMYIGMNDIEGISGYFWSSSVSSGTAGYYMRLDSRIVNPAYDLNKYYGFTVRCVVK